MGQNLGNFLPGNAVFPGSGQVVLERTVHQPLRHQGHNGDQGPVPQGKLLFPAPNLSEQYIIIQLCKLGRKLPQGISARCLFHCHISNASYPTYSSENVTQTVPSPSFSFKSPGSAILASLVKFQVFVP